MNPDYMKLLYKIIFWIGAIAVVFAFCWWRVKRKFRRLMNAVVQGDIAALESILKKQELSMDDLVLMAITADRAESLRFLLKQSSDALALQKEIREENGMSVFWFAVAFASPAVLRLLLESGMKPELEKESPWIYCCVEGKPEHARVLAEFGADVMTPEQRDESKGIGPIHAVVYGWFEHPEESLPMLNYLLERGEDVNALSSSGNTPLDLAYDETHVGFRTVDSLRDILEKAGAKRGASLRVPHPVYTIRLFLNEVMPDIRSYLNALPEGVSLTEHRSPWSEMPALLDTYEDLPEEFRDNMCAHTGWLEIRVTGQPGEYPPEVVKRGFVAARQLVRHYAVSGVQCGRYLGSSFAELEEDEINPLEMVHLVRAVTQDNVAVLCTDGMTEYGLPEYELIVPVSVCEKRNLNPLAAMLDVLMQAVNGTSCLEPGHTMTLMDCFTTVEWGETLLTQKQGFLIQMTGDKTPKNYLTTEGK